MNKTLIAGAKIFDATGDKPVRGGRARRGRSNSCGGPYAWAKSPRPAARSIDGKGMFLMPGMTEGHAHLSFETVTSTEDLITPPPEEHTLLTARVAKVLLDHGFTSA